MFLKSLKMKFSGTVKLTKSPSKVFPVNPSSYPRNVPLLNLILSVFEIQGSK